MMNIEIHDHLIDGITNVIFPAHYICWNQRSDIIALHAIGDGLTFLAYYAIPAILLYVTKKYHFNIRVKFIFWVYAVFILLCGTTHLFDTIMIWYINEDILIADGWLRIATGLFSVFSAIVTFYYSRMFLKFTKDFLGISVQMAKDRQEANRVHNETWDRWNEMRHDIERHLNNI